MWWIWVIGILATLAVANVIAFFVQRARYRRALHSVRNRYRPAPSGTNGPAMQAYDAVEVALPWGGVLRCRALPLKQAMAFIDLLNVAEAHPDAGMRAEAMTSLIDCFPAAVDAEEELNRFTPKEFFDAVRAFLAHRRIRQPGDGGGPGGPEPAAETTDAASASSP